MVLKTKETVNAISASLVEKGMVGMMWQSFVLKSKTCAEGGSLQ